MKKIGIWLGVCWLLLAGAAWADVQSAGNTSVGTAGEFAAGQPPSVLQPAAQGERVETLLDGNVYASGGFGGPGVKVSSIDGKPECLVGGRIGYIMNHHILIGIGGYGLATEDLKRTLDGQERRLSMGYGGMDFGYTFAPSSLIHFSVQTLIGAGGVGYSFDTDRWHQDKDGDTGHWETDVKGDAFFVVEPMLYMEVNMTKWCHLALGGGYRYVNGVDENVVGVSSSTLSGASGELLLKFGYF